MGATASTLRLRPVRRPAALALALAALLAPALAQGAAAQGAVEEERSLDLRRPVTVSAVAVAQTAQGLVGSVAKVHVSVAENGSGQVFMDTLPLTQVDMQGSARLAVRVAASVTGIDTSAFDFFFVVRSQSQVVGGPSAGGILAVAAIAALKGWEVDPKVMMTGTINPDGSIGPVGGVPEKAAAAAQEGATLFLFPVGQERVLTARGRATDLPSHCESQLRIQCIAVGGVEDAVRHVTGHEFAVRPHGGSVTDDKYRALLGPLARELNEEARSALARAERNLSAATDLNANVRRQLAETLRQGNATLADADAAVAGERYYTAASKSFQTSITARTVDLVTGLAGARDPDAYVEGVLADARRLIERVAAESRDARPATLSQLEAVGAAQVRATEAESRLASAASAWENRTYGTSYAGLVEQVAHAIERARTAPWWLRIGAAFTAGPAIDEARVRDAAQEAIGIAREIAVYKEAVLQESRTFARSDDADARLLEDAEADFRRGYDAAALFGALEAEVRAGLALELLGYEGTIPDEKVERARTEAERAILESREAGAEPILAVSYYEFAGSLPATDGLAFYDLARVIARIGGFLDEHRGLPRESRFVGDSAPRAPGAGATARGDRGPPTGAAPEAVAALAFGVGLAVGLGVAVVGVAVSRPGSRDPPPARVPVRVPPPPVALPRAGVVASAPVGPSTASVTIEVPLEPAPARPGDAPRERPYERPPGSI